MLDEPLAALAAILGLGIGSQWLAWRFQIPSILLLLAGGILLGPATGLLDPDAVFGDLLLPFVSIAVAIILFEGGLSLDLAELRKIGRSIRNLVTIGALVTWAVAAAAARVAFGLDPGLAILLGAILIVSGPTVIGPLLRHIRPTGSVGSILRWEGILIDPIGAMVAVLAFEAVLAGEVRAGPIVAGVLKTAGLGLGIGVAAAALVAVLMHRYLVPEFLEVAVALSAAVGAFTVSNALHDESGLMTVTIMGIVLATQRFVSVRRIVEFKENLRVLLLSGLFVVLAARLQRDDVRLLGLEAIGFLAALVFVGRPLAVWASTARSKLRRAERVFLSWMAPRGIVAAAVSSVFALRLAEEGRAGSEFLVPVTFAVIVATVALYGTTGPSLARRLGLATRRPQGVLIAGAHQWARSLAKVLQTEGFRVVVTDTNWSSISAARMEGLPTYYGSVLSDHALDELELGGIGRLMALTSNEEVNTLAVQRFMHVFGRRNLYQLAPKRASDGGRHSLAPHLRGRVLFGGDISYAALDSRFADAGTLKATNLSEEFDFDAFTRQHGDDAVPLFLISEGGSLTILAADEKLKPRPGQRLIALTRGDREGSPRVTSGEETG